MHTTVRAFASLSFSLSLPLSLSLSLSLSLFLLFAVLFNVNIEAWLFSVLPERGLRCDMERKHLH